MGSSEDLSIELVLIIGNSLSLLGGLFIIVLFIIFKSIRSYAFKLVVYMSVADAIRSLGYIIPNSSEALCMAQSVLTNFGSLSGVIWTSVIAFSIYCVVVLEMENIQSYEKFMVLIGFVLPLCITLLPFTTSSYGRAEGWCWIKFDQFELLWRIFAFYVIVLVAIVFNSFMYYKVIHEIRVDIGYLRGSSHDISEKKAVHTRFSFYPLIIIICYTPVLIKRLIEATAEESFYALNIISAVFMSIIGIFNAITYGFTDNVKEVLFGNISRASSLETNTGINGGLVNDVTEETSYSID